MRRHDHNSRGAMGGILTATLVLFFIVHLIFPAVTIWPYLPIVVLAASVIGAHAGKSRPSDQIQVYDRQ